VTGPERVRRVLDELAALAVQVAAEHAATAAAIAERYAAALRAGGTLFFAGNGGSAADAQHIATEYVVRFRANRPPLRAVALTTDTSLLTACATDMGFDAVFARQVEAHGRPGDVLVLHSTSGDSPNVVRAAQSARARDHRDRLPRQDGGRLRALADGPRHRLGRRTGCTSLGTRSRAVEERLK
jgi:D-sedoheptulose 7-phosphate isomerase